MPRTKEQVLASVADDLIRKNPNASSDDLKHIDPVDARDYLAAIDHQAYSDILTEALTDSTHVVQLHQLLVRCMAWDQRLSESLYLSTKVSEAIREAVITHMRLSIDFYLDQTRSVAA